jgi:hypothetical protein
VNILPARGATMQNLKSFQVFESPRQISRFKMDSSPPNNASSVAHQILHLLVPGNIQEQMLKGDANYNIGRVLVH